MLKRLRAIVFILPVVAAGPVAAATITTDAFVAVAGPALDLLDEADALALSNSDRAPVRAFARRARDSRVAAIRDLATWRRADAEDLAREKAGATLDHLGPVAGLVTLPYDAVADVSALIGPPATGLPSADAARARGRQDLGQLQMLRGAAFDSVYIALEVDALARLEASYQSFILNGDDPILRGLAVHDLPKVESLLVRARRL